jgi:hypothetical protein
MIVKAFRRLPLWVKVALIAVASLSGHLIDLRENRVKDYTTTLQAEIEAFQPFVLAGAFYQRLAECRYDWRFQCLCSYTEGYKLVDSPRSSGGFFLNFRIPPGKQLMRERIPHPEGCVQKESKWLSSRFDESIRNRVTGEVPSLVDSKTGVAGPIGLILFVGSKAVGIPDSYKFTAEKLLQNWLGWLLSVTTLVIAGLLIFDELRAGRRRNLSSMKDFAGLAFTIGGILLVSPILVGVVAFLFKWALWALVLAIGATFAGIAIVLGSLGTVLKPVEAATNILTAGKLCRRWLRQPRTAKVKAG